MGQTSAGWLLQVSLELAGSNHTHYATEVVDVVMETYGLSSADEPYVQIRCEVNCEPRYENFTGSVTLVVSWVLH